MFTDGMHLHAMPSCGAARARELTLHAARARGFHAYIGCCKRTVACMRLESAGQNKQDFLTSNEDE